MSSRKTEHSDTELRYFKLRDGGMNSLQAIAILRLSDSSRERLEGFYQAATRLIRSTDGSCPTFSHNDLHVAAITAAGFFPKGTEDKRWVRPDGNPWWPA